MSESTPGCQKKGVARADYSSQGDGQQMQSGILSPSPSLSGDRPTNKSSGTIDEEKNIRAETDTSIKVSVIQGNLHETVAEVIVNSVSVNLDLDKGYVSKSLLHHAGLNLQDAVKKQRKNGLLFWTFIETPAFDLKQCQCILQCAIEPLTNGKDLFYDTTYKKKCLEKLQKMVLKLLEKADSFKVSSIALPALATGNLRYPAQDVANAMFNAIQQFSKNRKTLNKVYIVIHKHETETFKVFHQEQECREADQKKDRKQSSTALQFGNTCVKAMRGPLGSVHADVLCYFWDIRFLTNVMRSHPLLNKMNDGEQKRFFKSNTIQNKEFVTGGSHVNCGTILHYPCSEADLSEAIKSGVKITNEKGSQSMSIYLDEFYSFASKGPEIAVELIKYIASKWQTCCLRNVSIHVETPNLFTKIAQVFEERKTAIPKEVELRLYGFRSDVEKAVAHINKQESIQVVNKESSTRADGEQGDVASKYSMVGARPKEKPSQLLKEQSKDNDSNLPEKESIQDLQDKLNVVPATIKLTGYNGKGRVRNRGNESLPYTAEFSSYSENELNDGRRYNKTSNDEDIKAKLNSSGSQTDLHNRNNTHPPADSEHKSSSNVVSLGGAFKKQAFQIRQDSSTEEPKSKSSGCDIQATSSKRSRTNGTYTFSKEGGHWCIVDAKSEEMLTVLDFEADDIYFEGLKLVVVDDKYHTIKEDDGVVELKRVHKQSSVSKNNDNQIDNTTKSSRCRSTIQTEKEASSSSHESTRPSLIRRNKQRVQVLKDDIINVKADVIVNSTSVDLNLDRGYVSSQINKLAGTQLQKAVYRRAKEINFWEYIVTPAFDLSNCKHIFHCALEPLNDNDGTKQEQSCLSKMRATVRLLLNEANRMSCKSIALPALGTGYLGYTPMDAATAIFLAVCDFVQFYGDRSHLEDIKIVIYQTEENTFQAFKKVEAEMKPELATLTTRF